MVENTEESQQIASAEVQMRKGMLVYCVLLLCSNGKTYTSELIQALHGAELIVVEGTLYPLLNRLAKENMLAYEWQESEQGPPRKYYWLTEDGISLLTALKKSYGRLHASIKTLEKEASERKKV